MKLAFYITIALIVLLSCNKGKDMTDKSIDFETTIVNNTSITFSKDVNKFSKLVKINPHFKPTNVTFKYVFIDNSGQNELFSIPGPSDYFLEAVLYFDTKTFELLRKQYLNKNIKYNSSNFDKNQFKFRWLDNEIKNELMKSDTSYHGNRDFIFDLGRNAKLWLLENKILLSYSSI